MVNVFLIPRVLCAIVPGITFEQFQATSGIASATVAKSVLKFLSSNNIGGTISNDSVIPFLDSDRLKAAILGIKMGCDVEQVSSEITWRDFEALGSEILLSMGYSTKKNVRFTKPTMEIDLVGVDSKYAVAIDCKHWKRSNVGSISNYAKKQVERANVLAERRKSSPLTSKVRQIVPAILTLHAERVKLVADGVPVIPVSQFRSFISDMPGFVSELCAVSVS